MTPSPTIGSPFKLPTTDKGAFLSLLLQELTLRARGTYEVGTNRADGQRLRVFNELSHRIVSQLSRALLSDNAAYPDGVFVQILRELADQGRCTADLQIAFDAAWAAWRANDKASEG